VSECSLIFLPLNHLLPHNLKSTELKGTTDYSFHKTLLPASTKNGIPLIVHVMSFRQQRNYL
jgi:hypothetical protein